MITITNLTVNPITILGQTIAASDTYTIPIEDTAIWVRDMEFRIQVMLSSLNMDLDGTGALVVTGSAAWMWMESLSRGYTVIS